MKLRAALLVLTGAFTISPMPTLAADRMTDREVKALVSRIEQGRDRFDDALDDELKHKVLRGPSGEVDVDRFLDDFQQNIDRLEERLKPDYAASAEAGTLLRQATQIDAFFREQAPGTKGESEWNRLASDLKVLANVYGADFPLPSGASVRRMGDREVAAGTKQVAVAAERLKKALDADLKQNPLVDKAARDAIVEEADQFTKDAKLLRDRVIDRKPSSAEADQLLARAARLQTFVAKHRVPTAANYWAGIDIYLQKLASAYRADWPVKR
jgi:hypothetical protein